MQSKLVLLEPRHRLRSPAEAMIRGVYAAEYSADIAAFPTTLAVLADTAGRPLAACGLRTANDHFFSEIYLDEPVERAVARRFDADAHRAEGIEITTLAAISPGTALRLVTGIVPAARRAGIRWAFFTATRRLRLLLGRAGLRFEPLVAADPARLADAASWGRYYETDPWVCALHAVDLPVERFRPLPAFRRAETPAEAAHA